MADQLKRYDTTTGTWIPVVAVNRIEVQGGGGTPTDDCLFKSYAETLAPALDGLKLNLLFAEVTPA